MRHNLKMIALTPENYLALKKLGGAGDSFNDVVSVLLKNNDKNVQIEKTTKGIVLGATAK